MQERARRTGLSAVFALSGALTLTCSIQIILEVFREAPHRPGLDCRAGVRALSNATERAQREAAARLGGETDALAAFRAALDPEWSDARALRATCERAQDAEALRALRAVEVRRYAEERAVRYEAVGLSQARRRAPALVAALTPSGTSVEPPPDPR